MVHFQCEVHLEFIKVTDKEALDSSSSSWQQTPACVRTLRAGELQVICHVTEPTIRKEDSPVSKLFIK